MDRIKQVAAHLSPFGSAQPGPKKHHSHELNPTYFLPKAARINPEQLAILHHTTHNIRLARTYLEFAERAKNLAYYLQEQISLSGKNTIALLASNTPMMLEAYYAIAAAGGVFAAVNYRLQKHEIQYIVKHSGAGTIIVDREYYLMVSDLDLRIIIDDDIDGSNGQYEECIRSGATRDKGLGWDDLTYEHVDEDETIGICYTSGTTGNPKGVEFTHQGVYLGAVANLIDSGLNCADAFGHGACKYLWTLPMFHAAGWIFPWAVTLAMGTHVCLRKMDYAFIWRLLIEEPVHHSLCGAPTACTMILNHESRKKLDHPVRVTIAASPPSPALFKSLLEYNFSPVHIYGLTETYGPVMRGYHLHNWTEKGEERYKLMARQGHGFSMSRAAKVLKTNPASGAMCEVAWDGKEMGEIAVHGNLVMKGYLNDPEATKKAFNAEKYFMTGDLAVVHPDGSVEIQDRGKDIIISGGENISSIDTESAVLRHPMVLECAVVAKRDEKWGEIPITFVTLKGQATEEDILASTKRILAGYKLPKQIRIVQELPKTSTGKVRKNELRELIKTEQ